MCAHTPWCTSSANTSAAPLASLQTCWPACCALKCYVSLHLCCDSEVAEYISHTVLQADLLDERSHVRKTPPQCIACICCACQREQHLNVEKDAASGLASKKNLSSTQASGHHGSRAISHHWLNCPSSCTHIHSTILLCQRWPAPPCSCHQGFALHADIAQQRSSACRAAYQKLFSWTQKPLIMS